MPGPPPIEPMDPSRLSQLNRAAQQQGFRDYQQYHDFTWQQSQRHGGVVVQRGQGGQPNQPAPPPPPPHQANHLNIGVAPLFNYLAQKLGGH